MSKRKPVKPSANDYTLLYGEGLPVTVGKTPLHTARQGIPIAVDTLRQYRVASLDQGLKNDRKQAEAVAAGADPQAARYAKEWLSAIEYLVESLKRDVRTAACAGIAAGVCAERLRCYLESPHVRQVVAMEHARDKYGSVREAALIRFRELENANPGRKKGLLEKQVCQEFKIKTRTFQRWRKTC